MQIAIPIAMLCTLCYTSCAPVPQQVAARRGGEVVRLWTDRYLASKYTAGKGDPKGATPVYMQTGERIDFTLTVLKKKKEISVC
jgi:hypothetical protein